MVGVSTTTTIARSYSIKKEDKFMLYMATNKKVGKNTKSLGKYVYTKGKWKTESSFSMINNTFD